MLKQARYVQSVVVPACNLNTREEEAGGLRDQPVLHARANFRAAWTTLSQKQKPTKKCGVDICFGFWDGTRGFVHADHALYAETHSQSLCLWRIPKLEM